MASGRAGSSVPVMWPRAGQGRSLLVMWPWAGQVPPSRRCGSSSGSPITADYPTTPNSPCLRLVLFPPPERFSSEFTGSDSDKRLCRYRLLGGCPPLPAPAEVLLMNLSEKSASPCSAQQRQPPGMEPSGGWMSIPGQEPDSTLPSILSGHRAAATSVTLPVPDFCAK